MQAYQAVPVRPPIFFPGREEYFDVTLRMQRMHSGRCKLTPQLQKIFVAAVVVAEVANHCVGVDVGQVVDRVPNAESTRRMIATRRCSAFPFFRDAAFAAAASERRSFVLGLAVGVLSVQCAARRTTAFHRLVNICCL